MSLIFANIIGYLYANKRTVAILAAILVIGLASILFIKWLSKPTVKLNEAEILKGQIAIEQHDEEALREVLVTSDVREKVRETSVMNAEANTVNAIHESRKTWENANISEMQAEFDRRANERR